MNEKNKNTIKATEEDLRAKRVKDLHNWYRDLIRPLIKG